MSKESKAQIKAQLRNEMVKEFKTKMLNLEADARHYKALYYEEIKKRQDAQYKLADTQEELDVYKDWVRRMQEFMDMDPVTREQAIAEYKTNKEIDETMKFIANSNFFKMFNGLFGM